MEKSKIIKNLCRSVRQYKRKSVSLKKLIQTFEKKNLLNEENSELLQNLCYFHVTLLQQKLNSRNKYSAKLPHPRTIGKWYEIVECNPEFTKEVLSTLEINLE